MLLVNVMTQTGSSCRYNNGDRLTPEHENFVLEKLLAYHPECEKKIGSGVDYMTVFLFSLANLLSFIEHPLISLGCIEFAH